ncbi:MAG: hypothetical protein ACYDHF_06250 [Candidatus Cryosericum sp.]
MIWTYITIFSGGLVTGGFLALGFAVLILAPHLERLRLAVDLLAARRKPGRKPKAAGLTPQEGVEAATINVPADRPGNNPPPDIEVTDP